MTDGECMWGICFVAMALVTTMLQGQQTVQPGPQPQKASKPEVCTIEGQVVSTTTGEPLRKASVLLSQIGKALGESYTTTTTAGGRFAFQDIESGRYRLQATRNGYGQIQYGFSGPSHQVTTLSLDPGQHLPNIVLRLTPQSVITGR